ncbi:MAG: hypothetical protein EPO26_05140 [Chloroflexota bacterium]|nr:MAG: hypothetical protein EPO26_05140 [Chloroflexota bacterium]
MVLTFDELNKGLPEGLTREQAAQWLKSANATVEAAVGMTATREQMRQMSSENWHRLKEDPHAVSDAVRRAHQQYRARFDNLAANSGP